MTSLKSDLAENPKDKTEEEGTKIKQKAHFIF